MFKIIYQSHTETVEKVTHIPLGAIRCYLFTHSNVSVKEIVNFFKNGLKGYPKNHFLIDEGNWGVLIKKDQNRYIKEPISLKDDNGNDIFYFISNQFSNKHSYDNLAFFVRYIESEGFVVLDEMDKPLKPKDYIDWANVPIEDLVVVDDEGQPVNGNIANRKTDELKDKPFVPIEGKGNNVKHPPFGEDEDGYFIKYDSDIPNDKKVPGLVEKLESEYERILGFYRDLLNDHIFDICRIPVVLSMEHPIDNYYLTDKEIVNIIKRKFKSNSSGIASSDITSVIENRNIKLRRSGGYFHNKINNIFNNDVFRFEDGAQPVIYIYYTNIEFVNFDNYISRLTQALAHEFFHFIHDCMSPVFSEVSNSAKKVKESLADMSSVLYLVYHKDSYEHSLVAENRYKWWDDFYPSKIPYVYARLFYYSTGNWFNYINDYDTYEQCGLINKYYDVIKDSTIDMAEALLTLRY